MKAKMKELDQQIANTIRRYPTLFACRTSVLHQWFCVIGNGREWVNGRLVSREDERPLLSRAQTIEKQTEWLVKRAKENKKIFGNCPERRAVDAYNLRFEIDMVGRRYDLADHLALMSWPRPCPSRRDRDTDIAPEKIYPWYMGSHLSNVPDDVQPEYLAAAREMLLEIFQSQPWQYEWGFEMKQEEILAEHERSLQMADGIAQELARRFGPGKKPNSLAEYHLANKRREEMFKEFLRSLKVTSTGQSEPSMPNSSSDALQPEDECHSPIGGVRG